MRIALVCSEVIRESGHGRYMLELARRLAPRHEVHVFADLYQPVEGTTFRRVPAPEGVNLIRLVVFWLRSTRALGREPFDVVHTIGGCCARRDVVTAQFVQRAWGAELAALEAADARARAAGAPPLLVGSALRRVYHRLYWRVADLFEAPAFRTGPGRRLIAVSARVRDELARWYGADPGAVAVVFNGVEPAEFAAEVLAPLRAPARAELGLPDDAPALLFIGDFYRKGLGTAIRALGLMKTPGARLVVVGRGEIAAFRAHAEAAGVADRVAFVGFQKDVRPYFAAADAFVFPTRYEPFGMVVTEAMAAGLPAVTTRAAGASEVITPGADGMVVDDPDDAPAFAAALDEVLADPARRAAMGAAARRRAAEVSWAWVAAETEKVYADLLAERARRG